MNDGYTYNVPYPKFRDFNADYFYDPQTKEYVAAIFARLIDWNGQVCAPRGIAHRIEVDEKQASTLAPPSIGQTLDAINKCLSDLFVTGFIVGTPTRVEKHADHEACKELAKTRHVHPYGRQPTFEWHCVECGLPFNVTKKSKLSAANDRVFHKDMAELDEFRRLQGLGKCLNG